MLTQMINAFFSSTTNIGSSASGAGSNEDDWVARAFGDSDIYDTSRTSRASHTRPRAKTPAARPDPPEKTQRSSSNRWAPSFTGTTPGWADAVFNPDNDGTPFVSHSDTSHQGRVQYTWSGFFSSSGYSVGRAERELRDKLKGESIRPGQTYVVQLDRANSGWNHGRLKGRTYIFRGGKNGTLRFLGDMASSSQPTGDDGRRSSFKNARRHGYAYLLEGVYTVGRFDSSRMGGDGGYTVQRARVNRDRNYNGKIDGREAGTSRTASGILFHDRKFGSAGCQIVADWLRFRNLVGPRGFTYVLVRD